MIFVIFVFLRPLYSVLRLSFFGKSQDPHVIERRVSEF